MGITVIERVKIQAQVLVPLVKALQAELGEERANALVRKTLGDIFRRLGQQWWQSKQSEHVVYTTWHRPSLRGPEVTPSITGSVRNHKTSMRSMSLGADNHNSTKNWASLSLDFGWPAAKTSRLPKVLAPG